MTGALHLDGYIRVSKVGGRSGEHFISPAVQREQIAAWAASRSVVIAEWHTDLDQSGGKLRRPGLDELMGRLRAGETGGVAVARLDRLSRAGVADALKLVEEIHGLGRELAVVDLGIDPTTPMGEFAVTVLLALARMQRRQIAESWAIATERAIKRGAHTHAPFGYRRGAGGVLELDPAEAPVIADVFRRRVAGASWTDLARWLDTQAPPRTAKHWTRRSVETIVRNRAYLGEARYGQHVNASAHVALVGLDDWEMAQEARGVRAARGEPGLVSGLIRCAGCRYRMAPATAGTRKQKIYRCKVRHGAGQCLAPAYADRALLDEHVAELFLAHYGDLAMEGRQASVGIADARRAVADAEAELAAFRDNTAIRDALAAVGGFEEGLRARVERVLAARDALEAARRTATGMDFGDLTAMWPTLSTEERRRIVSAGIDCVFLRRAEVPGRNVGIDPARVRVFWRGHGPRDLPGPGRFPDFRPLDE